MILSMNCFQFQVLGKSAPFSIKQSVDLQESLIKVHEGVSFDDNLVLIDKINPIVAPSIAIADSCPLGSEAALAERLVSGLSIFDDVGIDLDSPTLDGGENDRPPPHSANPSDVLFEDTLDVVETSNVTETSSDKSISCNFLQEETKRRKVAESAVKVLSDALDRQMKFITKQTNELIESRLGCDKANCLNAELREENFVVQEQNDTFESEMGDIRVAAQSYQLDCAKLKRQLQQDNELIDQLKIQILEDRQEHQDDMGELRDRSIEQIELLEQNSIRLEKELAKERARFRTLANNYEALSTGSISPPVSPPLRSTSDHQTQTQICEDDVDISDIDITEQESGKIEKLESKLKEQTEAHEVIIDRLERDLRDEVESKTTISREYEKTIRELESRVVNESTNASRAENDLAVAENRFKEANNDIKYFRQQFIETEQKLQVNQRQLSKALEEVSLLRQALNTYINGGDTTDAMSALSDNDDIKSIVGESTCVSTSTSVENFIPDRRRQAGDVTDYTDDESSNNWYYRSNNTHHYQHHQQQHQQGGFDSFNIPQQPFHVSQEEGDGNGTPSDGAGSIYQQPLPAGLIPIRKTTDPESNEQHISVVETRRPPARKQRRKYGKPIDLTPSSSLTNIAFNDRPNSNSRDRQHMQQQFNKNIAEIDRSTLEKQYAAIRQHRNSLIRENNFLKNKCHRIKQDLLFTEKNLQNFSLEAEHKIAMLLMALNNQEYVSTQDLNALLQMFPVPTSQQITYPQQQLSQDQHQQQQQRQSMYLLESPNQSANNSNINNADNVTAMNGFLSPYAPEYQPNPMAPNPMASDPMTAAYHDMMASAAASNDDQQMFMQPNPVQPMDYQQFMDYQQQQQIVHPQHQQIDVEDVGVADANNNNYVMSVPSQLPETPVPQEVVDASNQLAAIGVPISKTF